MVQRFFPTLNLRQETAEMWADPTGRFVHYSDYAKVEEQLRLLLRWGHRIDPYNLSDAELSDFDEDFETARKVLEKL